MSTAAKVFIMTITKLSKELILPLIIRQGEVGEEVGWTHSAIFSFPKRLSFFSPFLFLVLFIFYFLGVSRLC